MGNDYDKRPVIVTREWYETILKPLFKKSPDDYLLFNMSCWGYAMGLDTYPDTLEFADKHLQELLELTRIRRWKPGKPGFIGVKKKRGRPRKAESKTDKNA